MREPHAGASCGSWRLGSGGWATRVLRWSQHDKGIGSRSSRRAKAAQRVPWRPVELAGDVDALEREQAPVVCRLIHEQNDHIDVAIPALERDASRECLKIAKTSLGLDTD